MVLEKYSFTCADLHLKRSSLVRAMGYPEDSIPAEIQVLADEVMTSGEELCEIKGGYRIIDSIRLDRDHFNLDVDEISLQIRQTVFEQINLAEKIAVIVCTAGHKISARAKDLMNRGDLLKGYIYDVFGSVVVEAGMDLIQQKLQNSMSNLGFRITNRYSPGYCGWKVSEQKKLFQLIPEKFCGIELTDSCLMLPMKSVSGIIGIGKEVRYNPYTCNLCDMENCFYRNLKMVE